VAIGRRGTGALAIVAALAAVLGFIRWRSREGERSERMEKNARGSRRIIEEIFGAGNYELAHELIGADAVGHDPALPAPVAGPDGVAGAARGYRDAFPDLKLTVNQLIADGDHVATRWTAKGTHKGDLFGIAPTGKEATVTGITIDRWADGKVAESWTNWDTLGLLQQLGAVPAAMQTA
jgi:steroid delta-isomerase-like uncharacterized protein